MANIHGDIRDNTCTSLFLVPALGLDREKITKQGFIDGFLDDIGHDPHYENCVYIVFKPHDILQFSEFLKRERERIDIVEDYDYDEFVVAVYKIPEDLMDDYYLFLQGKYSQFSKKFKDKFRKIVNTTTKELSLQWMVFEKHKDLRKLWEEEFDVTLDDDNELWRVPDLNKEVLDINELKIKTDA